MGLLEQYEKEHPKAFREPKWEPHNEYGFWVRLVMRLSGGRIRDLKQANTVLIILAVLIGLATLAVILANFRVVPYRSGLSKMELKRQLEEYRKIQPFE